MGKDRKSLTEDWVPVTAATGLVGLDPDRLVDCSTGFKADILMHDVPPRGRPQVRMEA